MGKSVRRLSELRKAVAPGPTVRTADVQRAKRPRVGMGLLPPTLMAGTSIAASAQCAERISLRIIQLRSGCDLEPCMAFCVR